jgi:hypothetical protein
MSTEQKLIDKTRSKVGDDGLKFVVVAGGELLDAINADISACWAKWLETSKGNLSPDGKALSPYLFLAAALISQAASTLQYDPRTSSRETFVAMCGDIFDLLAEASVKAKRQ